MLFGENTNMNIANNLIGKRFGYLLVVDKVNKKWLCQCNCGKLVEAETGYLNSGRKTSCGCKRSPNLTGKRFERLTVIREEQRSSRGEHRWLCLCDCGAEIIVLQSSLTTGNTKSCGCLKIEKTKNAVTKHGMRGSKFYTMWQNMKDRCTNPNNDKYIHYGGRGVSFCDDWSNFENFKEDLYESYLEHIKYFGEKQTTLDRINVDGNYCKENCKFSTQQEQVINRRKQRWFRAISPNGEIFISRNQQEFADIHNLARGNIYYCLKNSGASRKGWKFEYVNMEEC